MDVLGVVAAVCVVVTVALLVRRFLGGSNAAPQPSTPTKTQEKTDTRSAPQKEKKAALKIFFGSQTGTAEDFANTLSDEGLAYGFAPEVVDLDDFEPDVFEEPTLAIFCMATYGEGEPTDNARKFYDWLNEEHDNTLTDLQYAVFGLGNKTYEQFNKMGKDTDKYLETKGAKRLYALGMGDDDQSLEEDFDKWKRELWRPFCAAAGLDVVEHAKVQKQRRYEMKKYDATPEKLMSHLFQIDADAELNANYAPTIPGLISANHKSYKMYDSKNPFLGKILAHRELHGPGSDRSCLHIEIELIKNAYLRYQPGDHIGVFPENDPDLVEHVGKRLGLDLNQIVKLVPAGKSKAPALGPFTLRRAFTTYLDLTTRPRQSFLREIAQFAGDDEDRARLLRLGDTSSDDAVAAYNQHIMKDYRSIVDILDEFPSLHPPIDVFLEMVPRLDPRFYSISSSMAENPSVVSLTAVVVEVKKRGGKLPVHKGVCTNWLKRMQGREIESLIPCFMRKSEFKLPKDPSTPIIMIGPGTGLAPFRGFLQWRKHNRQNLGPAILFFGCRNSNVDYLYREELEAAVKDGYLTSLVTAFSREQNQKVYVQHRLDERAEELYEQYLRKNGVVYVCGDATMMAKDVHACIRRIIQKFEGKSEEEAEKTVSAWKKAHRYQEDIWHSV